MKKSLEDIYLIILFFLYNLLLVDVTVFGLGIKTMLLLGITLIVMLIHTIKRQGERLEIHLTHLDMVICAAGICGLVVFVYKLIADPLNYEPEMTVLTLCLLYYLIRVRREPVDKDLIFLFSISNAIVSVMLLIHYVVNADLRLPIDMLLENNAIFSWLILAITVNAVGYCIYEGKEIWYGVNAVVGFFLLFIQKNVIAIGMMGVLLLLLPLVYMPTKRLIKNSMQMFFGYAFLLCNMSLLTGYTELIKVTVTYDLEISVYLELGLAIFGVFFFHYWDKYISEEDDDRMLFPELREFFKKVLCVIAIVTVVFMAAMIRGNTAIIPEILGRIIEQGRVGLVNQVGSFEAVAESFGGIGVGFLLYLYYTMMYCLIRRKKTKVSRHQKLFRIVTVMFLMQSLFLTQSMMTVSIYLVFVISFLKDTNLFGEKMKGEDTNEIDYSDSML